MWFRKFLLPVAVAALLGGCGDAAEPAGTQATEPVQTTPPPTTAGGGEDYCAAIAEMAARQPAGSMSDAELEAAMTAYAEAIEQVAALSPADEAATLGDLADAVRDAAVDPTDPDLAARMGALGPAVAAITLRASRDCGVEFATE